TQYAVGLGAGDNLDEAGGIVGSHGATAGSEGEHADVDFNAFGLQLLLVLANPGGFRMGVDNRRDQVVVHLRLVTGDALGNHHALFRRLVGQHQAAYHVTDGVHARYRRSAMIIDIHIAAFVQINTGIGSQQIGSNRATANGNDQLVESHFLIALGISELDGDFLTLHFGRGHACTQQHLEALLGVDFQGFLGQLLIRRGQELVQRLDNGYICAQARPDRAQLQTDNASADHAQTGRNALEVQGTGKVDDDLLVHRRRGDLHRTRARGQDHVLGGQHFAAAVFLGDLDLLASQQLAVALVDSNAVGLEQTGDAAGEVSDDLVLAGYHRANVHLHLTGADAVDLECILCFMVFPGAVQ